MGEEPAGAPEGESPQYGDTWGEDIPPERKAELEELAERQRAWAKQPEATRDDSHFNGVLVTGAEVFYLAARAHAGPDADAELLDAAAARLRSDDSLVRRGISLDALHLEGAILAGAHLGWAILAGAHLEGTFLGQAHLQRADLTEARLQRAVLFWARLEEATLVRAHLEEATLGRARLETLYVNPLRTRGCVPTPPISRWPSASPRPCGSKGLPV
jgi:uncharacterized protein YjbI with pentapeptide repeats